MKNMLLAGAIALSMGVWASASAAPPQSSTTTTTSTSSYAARSSEARRIVDWLVSQDAPARNGALERYADNGSFSVTSKASRAWGASQSVDGAPPSKPLPANARDGDVLEITHPAGEITEAWTYTRQGGNQGEWELTDYKYHRKLSPPR
jgi:hypothetical protein